MINSKIEFINGRASLVIDGKREPGCAYITYFDEFSHCDDFAKVGYEMFSLCASFSGLPLNSKTGFSPLFGIFDIKDKPDFSHFDRNVGQILKSCPNAKIFPRVRVSMPLWWVQENESETCQSPIIYKREALFSDKFREMGAQMLREFIAHVHAADYADNIIGYQIAGGGTEEWYHFDEMGSLSDCSEQKFNDYLKEHYPAQYSEEVKVPDYALFSGEGMVVDRLAQRYLEFISFSVAETVAYFAKVVKECVKHRQIVGTFYGYVQDIPKPLQGSCGLNQLLDCPDIDFFCSPGSYVNMRALGMDWAERSAGESIKQHGKLYFLENDIRTCLTKIPDDCRPGIDPEKKYSSKLWLGPSTVEQSVWAVRKAYARQLTHANALWWFDMWGGWYACDELMNEMKLSLELMKKLTESNLPTTRSQVAVLFDEKYPFRVGMKDPCFTIQQTVHDRVGNTGMTFDAFLTEDYEQSVYYKAVLIPFPDAFDSDEIVAIKVFLKSKNIPYVQLTTDDVDISPNALRERLINAGVHCYCSTGDVIYHGNGYLAIHAATAGNKTVTLPCAANITKVNEERTTYFSDTIEVIMEQFETLLFRVEDVNVGR